jgi:hypothetical protein
MTIAAYVDGKQIEPSLEDLDYIELDIVKDFVRQHENLESNDKNAKVEIDFSNKENPTCKLKNCTPEFEKLFSKNFPKHMRLVTEEVY